MKNIKIIFLTHFCREASNNLGLKKIQNFTFFYPRNFIAVVRKHVAAKYKCRLWLGLIEKWVLTM